MAHQKSSQRQTPVVKTHYPYVTKVLVDLFLKGELPFVQTIDIEPEYGYVGRLVYQNDTVRMFRGSDVGINFSGAKQIAADKGYAKHFLKLLGYNTPPGKVFLLPQYVSRLNKSLSKYMFNDYSHIEKIQEYILSTVHYPCFIKPNTGAQGKGVYKCMNEGDVAFAVAQYQQDHVDALLVEEAVDMPDYRVVVFCGEMIACYLRTPLSVVGDGKSTIKELLSQAQAQFTDIKRTATIDIEDARIGKQLAKMNYHLDTILPLQITCPIYDVSNLSLGGKSIDVTNKIGQHWRDLCIALAADMGLNLCGVDIACSDIENAAADYSIIEINDSPGLANYAAEGEEQSNRVRALYKKVFADNAFGYGTVTAER